jgi:hypothetical protein
VVVFSIHWGGNWGYSIPAEHREFAYNLLDDASIDLIYGHSSHHPMGLEVHNNKLIIYGAGDFINDYEGISGHEEYRGELTLMYFPEFDINSGQLKSLKMIPMEMKNFRLNRAENLDVKWLYNTLNRECKKLGTTIRLEKDNSFWLKWQVFFIPKTGISHVGIFKIQLPFSTSSPTEMTFPKKFRLTENSDIVTLRAIYRHCLEFRSNFRFLTSDHFLGIVKLNCLFRFW